MKSEHEHTGLWTELVTVCPICQQFVSADRFKSHYLRCQDAQIARKTGYPTPKNQEVLTGFFTPTGRRD